MLLIILAIFNPLIIKWILNRKNADFKLHKILKIYTKISERGRIKHLRSLIFIGKNIGIILAYYSADAAMRKRANSSMKSMVFEIPSTEELRQRS